MTKIDFQDDVSYFTYDSANNRVVMKNAAYLEASYQHDGAGTTTYTYDPLYRLKTATYPVTTLSDQHVTIAWQRGERARHGPGQLWCRK